MINKQIENLKKLSYVLPGNPGVYQFYDKFDKIIYIGKAKNLKKRVSSYFANTQLNTKTRILVRKIVDIKHIIVSTEQDALLLENSLIKKYQPRYNILLKDDKSYPWICIKNEDFPRVFSTRNPIKDGSLYFGPYTSGKMVKLIINLIHQLYKLRNCNYKLSPKNIASGKFKVCLEYHIGNCLAPCIAQQSENEYNESIEQIKNILKGNLSTVIDYLSKIMVKYSENFEFEKAQIVKEKLNLLKTFQSKSTVVSAKIHNIDVFSYVEKDKIACVNYLKVINGAIIQSYTAELKGNLEETKKELLNYAVIDIRNRLSSTSKEILLPFSIIDSFDNVKIVIPQRGDKKQLLDLSTRNAKYFLLEKLRQKNKNLENTPVNRKLLTLLNDLHLKELPIHIECFDNSNIQGTNPVASCVVFKNTKPSKKEYRYFNIKTVVGANDFASMQEVVYRRYKRLLNEKKLLPQLIVIDGGKGQLKFAKKALDSLGISDKIAIIGIAKRLEEIFFPNDSVPIYLDKNSESLKIIQHLRNEAHRFAINFHRQKRSNSLINTELNNISGIGEKTIVLLFSEYKSVEKIKELTMDELSTQIGQDKAKKIINYFKKYN